jgi:prepilin-type N-terminal cleavage/methylation domain-containing protein
MVIFKTPHILSTLLNRMFKSKLNIYKERIMMNQKGFTLTEISMAVGVVSALVIGGAGFYSNAIAKAQANQGMVIGKLVLDDVFEYFARNAALPDPSDLVTPTKNYAGDWSDTATGAGPAITSYIDHAHWDLAENSTTSGYIEVHFKSSGVQKAVAGKILQLRVHESANASHLVYDGCFTDIDGGRFDGVVATPGSISPILQECEIDAIIP